MKSAASWCGRAWFGIVVVVMAVLRESRRARGRDSRGPAMASGGLGAARLAVAGGLLGRRLRAGLTVGGLAAGQELDALGDHVDPRGVVALLALLAGALDGEAQRADRGPRLGGTSGPW